MEAETEVLTDLPSSTSGRDQAQSLVPAFFAALQAG